MKEMDELVEEYLEYLKDGISFEELYSIMKYDYDLFLEKEAGIIDRRTDTNIVSFDDAEMKFKALKKAYRKLTFPGYKFLLKVENKNTTLD